jgi:DNA-binding CsgD family transcriptional regulator
MVSVDKLSDPRELRNYLRDLIALSALPATWKAYEPQRIAESVAAALIAVLSPDFVHVSLPCTGDHPSGEITHVNPQMTLALVNAAKSTLHRAELRTSEQTMSIIDPSGGDQLRIVSSPTGSGGTLVAGSLRPGFPSDKDRLLVTTAAGNLTIALNHLLSMSSEGAPTDHRKEIAKAVARLDKLSPRARQILEALASGHTNKVIAYDLGISERTVEVHRARMMKQLGVHHLSEAIRLALLAGLADRTKS